MRPLPRRARPPLLLLAAAICLFAGCSSPSRRAFYYWRSGSAPSARETALLDRLRVDRLYLRLFDLDDAGEPAAALSLTREAASNLGAGREIVPVVYVVPEALRNQATGTARDLGVRTAREVLARCRSAGISPPEVQIDYDWTAGTREGYFAFLAGAREELAAAGAGSASGASSSSGAARIVLSATIRLHQVKDRKTTGVPPVDRGLLMAYNLSAPADPSVRNSILDMEVLEPYLSGLRGYPLELDVALPCFSWIVHFENQRVLGLIPYTEAAGALADSELFEGAGGGWLEARARTYVAGRSVEPGDRLRLEKVEPELVLEAARALAARLPRSARSVAFYSLDASSVELFSGGSDEAFLAPFSALGAGAASRP